MMAERQLNAGGYGHFGWLRKSGQSNPSVTIGEIITGCLTRENVITCSPVVDRGCRLMKDYLSITLVGWRDYEEMKETYVNWPVVMDWLVGSHSLFGSLVCEE